MRRLLLPLLAVALLVGSGTAIAADRFTGVAAAHPEPGDTDGDDVFEGPNAKGRPFPDNCPLVRNADQVDTDRDDLGNPCDSDDDADGVADRTSDPRPVSLDNCRLVANVDQEDSDGDGVGDACDFDRDSDGVQDGRDNCVDIANADQKGSDNDELGDVCDPDDDNDTIEDGRDNCPLVDNFDQTDRDGDGKGTVCDEGEGLGGSGSAGGVAGTDSPSGGSGGGPSAPTDRVAPTVSVRIARVQRPHDLAGGMRVSVTCSEACALVGELRLDRRAARRVRTRVGIVGRGTASLGGRGRTWLFLRAGATMRRKLFARRAGTVTATLSVKAVDGARNQRSATRTLSLRR